MSKIVSYVLATLGFISVITFAFGLIALVMLYGPGVFLFTIVIATIGIVLFSALCVAAMIYEAVEKRR